jgi:nucleotide-binding universal stress UspA family protein
MLRRSQSLPALWSDLLDEKVETARSRLLSIAEFAADLDEVITHPESPLDSVQFNISRLRLHDIGIQTGSGDIEGGIAKTAVNWLVDDFGDGATCRGKLTYKSTYASSAWLKDPRLRNLLGSWARAFWKGEARDLTGFLWWHNRNLKWSLVNTLTAWKGAFPFVGAVHLGLAHRYAGGEQPGGDRFFDRWSVLLDEILPRQALLIRKRTDEFVILLPCSNKTEPQALANRVSSTLHLYDGSQAGAWVGIATVEGATESISAEMIAKRAEDAAQALNGAPINTETTPEVSTLRHGLKTLSDVPTRPPAPPQNAQTPIHPRTSRNPHPPRSRVFVSYSHADMEWLQRLQKHLKPLQRDGVEVWDDTRLKAGEQWREEIREALANTKIAILLISADFLASDFIVTNELPPLLKAAEEDGATILPVIISPCRFTRMESLSRFQAVNDPAKPLVQMRRASREKVLDDVARAVEDALKR